jgi:mRNA-degrading endonuclease YafQ of YafQ-DinJ toxin-antitoxin module
VNTFEQTNENNVISAMELTAKMHELSLTGADWDELRALHIQLGEVLVNAGNETQITNA